MTQCCFNLHRIDGDGCLETRNPLSRVNSPHIDLKAAIRDSSLNVRSNPPGSEQTLLLLPPRFATTSLPRSPSRNGTLANVPTLASQITSFGDERRGDSSSEDEDAP